MGSALARPEIGVLCPFARRDRRDPAFTAPDQRQEATIGTRPSLRFRDCDVTLVPCPAPGPDRRAAQEDNVLSSLQDAAGASAARAVPVMAQPFNGQSDALLARILTSLDDDKAENVVTIDLRGRSSVADFMVVCSGRSSRQVSAIAEKLVERLKDEMGRSSKVEGKEQGDWVLIDAQDVIVHVFRPEVREFYQLEKMWMPAGIPAAAKTN